ncbi:MAG: HAD-IA family hydrolase [Candidatus Omnitrophota bacterium]
MVKITPARLPFGVILDMDGVLVDSEPFICRAASMMFAEHSLMVKPEDFVPFVGAGENRYLGGVAAKYGFPLNLERDKRRTYEIYLEIIKGELQPLPGVPGFIEECRKNGKKMALATSADDTKVLGTLKEIGLPPDSFEAMVTGSNVTRKKPDPEIFLAAARNLGLDARDCLVVEDALNGVVAAKRSGARCLALTTSFSRKELISVGADWCAENLANTPDGVLFWHQKL